MQLVTGIICLNSRRHCLPNAVVMGNGRHKHIRALSPLVLSTLKAGSSAARRKTVFCIVHLVRHWHTDIFHWEIMDALWSCGPPRYKSRAAESCDSTV